LKRLRHRRYDGGPGAAGQEPGPGPPSAAVPIANPRPNGQKGKIVAKKFSVAKKKTMRVILPSPIGARADLSAEPIMQIV
jgi:hypothetical protein